MKNSDGEECEEDLESESVLLDLHSLIKEYVDFYLFGLKKRSLNDLMEQWPDFYSFLSKEHGDILPGSVIAIKQKDSLSLAVPYVLLPDTDMTVVFWDSSKKSASYSQSQDLAHAIARFKKN